MEEPPPLQQSLPEEPATPAMSLTGRLLNIFATPGEVFDDIKPASPAVANWLAPALIFMVVSWLVSAVVLTQPAIKQQMDEMLESGLRKQFEKAHLPKEKIEEAVQNAKKWVGITTLVGSYAGPILIGLISPFAWGFLIWLGGAKVFKGNFEYMKAVEVVGLGNMIGVLDVIVKGLLILVMGNVFAAPSPVLLVKDFNPQNPIHSLLALANVMTLWILAVRAIGLARLANVSVAKAAAWVVGIWVVYTGFFWGLGQAAQLVSKRMTGS
jgi:hypothetical protein